MGPDLTHVGSRRDQETIRQIIEDPLSNYDESEMPPFGEKLTKDRSTHWRDTWLHFDDLDRLLARALDHRTKRRRAALTFRPALGVHAVAVQLDLRRLLAVFAAVFRSGRHNAVAAGVGALLLVLLLGHWRSPSGHYAPLAAPSKLSRRWWAGRLFLHFDDLDCFLARAFDHHRAEPADA